MKILISSSAFLILYFAYGFYISQSEINVIPVKLEKASSDVFYDYKGAINVHTDLSLGSGTHAQVTSAAKMAGLDFVLFSDLNTFSIPYQIEGYQNDTLVLTGGKYSYLDARFIYYSKEKQVLGENLGESQTRVSDLLSQQQDIRKDDLLILAHPFKSGYSWSGEIPAGLDGMEIMNLKSAAQRAWDISKISVFWSLFTYPFNPQLAFIRLFYEPSEEISLFDQTSETKKISLFSGAEASARAVPWDNFLIRFPTYQKSFELFSNHILLRSELTGQFQSDKQKIFSALKNGHFYLGFDLLGDPSGFTAVIERGHQNFLMGSKLKFEKGLVLKAEIPTAPTDFFELVVYRNGLRYATTNSSSLNLQIQEPGVYRLQVRVSVQLPIPDGKKWLTWIYANPFYIE
jgi:hypothetical protein